MRLPTVCYLASPLGRGGRRTCEPDGEGFCSNRNFLPSHPRFARELPPRGSLFVTFRWKASSVRQSRLARLSVCHLLQQEKAYDVRGQWEESGNVLFPIGSFLKPSPWGKVAAKRPDEASACLSPRLARGERWIVAKRQDGEGLCDNRNFYPLTRFARAPPLGEP